MAKGETSDRQIPPRSTTNKAKIAPQTKSDETTLWDTAVLSIQIRKTSPIEKRNFYTLKKGPRTKMGRTL